MRYVVWILRIVVLIVVLLFAKNNASPVKVTFFAEYAFTDVPLVVVMAVSLILGLLLGGLLTLGPSLRKGREITKLKREVERLELLQAEQAQRFQAQQAQHYAEQSALAESVTPLAPM